MTTTTTMSHSASEHHSEIRDEEPTPFPENQDQQGEASNSDNMAVEPNAIVIPAAQSHHADRATRFVYNAFVSVVHRRLPVDDWDEHDYKYLAVIALALEHSLLPLEALVWDPEAEWSRAKAAAAQAAIAHIGNGRKLSDASNDKDLLCDVENDTYSLFDIFKLGDKENPYAPPVDESGTGV